jgi:mannan polymerase II complex MNN10 subunit
MVSTQSSFRLPAPGNLLPKILVGLLVIGIFIQLQWSTSKPAVRTPATDSVPTTLDDKTQKNWFEDAKKANQIGDEDSTPPQYFADPKPADPTPPAEARPTTAFTGTHDYSKTFISYGTSKCMPEFNDQLQAAAVQRNKTCAKHAPFPAEETRRVAFATITTGKPADAYQRAILSQMFASAVHGTSTHVLCEQLSDGAWNKIAFLLNLVMNEMLKPESERLEWVMWIDRDAIVLDACRPLSSFLPPNTDEFKDVNLITNNDAFGLNAGVFIFKVSDWSTDLFNTILAYRYFRPDDQLVLAEQTAMEKIIHEDKWKKNVVRVPWYWFNAYPDEEDSVRKYKQGLEPENLEWFRARKGDYVVHFAGDDGRSGRMPEWLDMLAEVGNVYEKKEQQRDVTKEVQQYWSAWKSNSLTDAQISGEKWREENVDNRQKKQE